MVDLCLNTALTKIKKKERGMSRVLNTILLALVLFQTSNLYANSQTEVVKHNLEIELYPNQGYLLLKDTFEPGNLPKRLIIPTQIEDLEVKLGHKTISYRLDGNADKLWQEILPSYWSDKPCGPRLSISYKFIPKLEDYQDGGMGHDQISNEVNAVILDKGVYLAPSSYWYPYIKTTHEQFAIRVSSPKQWSTMTSGTLEDTVLSDDRKMEQWSIDYNSEMIHLIANKFDIKEQMHRGVKLQTYFHPELQGHSQTYIEKLKNYLDLYLDFFGSYPFDKFAVVSNFFSTGYGMASYTLLDKNIIPYSFIVDTSLGHELLHNYWGNSIYVDFNTGNWCEGLTVYQADYLYKEQISKQEAMIYRRNVLRKYENFVHTSNVFSVADFRSRFNSASQAIGYGKVMMIFHMLKLELGAQIFDEGLTKLYNEQLYKYLSWQDFQDVYELLSGKNLESFFNQWIKRKDVLDLKLESTYRDNQAVITISQNTATPYNALVPLRITYLDGSTQFINQRVTQISEVFTLDHDQQIKLVELDPMLDLMRRPFDFENPATLNKFWGSQNKRYLSTLPKTEQLQTALSNIVGGYDNQEDVGQVQFVSPTDIDLETLKGPLSLFLTAQDLKSSFFQDILKQQKRIKHVGDTLIFVEQDKSVDLLDSFVALSIQYKKRPIVLNISFNEQTLLTATKKLSHYGKYSYVVMSPGGRKKFAGNWGD